MGSWVLILLWIAAWTTIVHAAGEAFDAEAEVIREKFDRRSEEIGRSITLAMEKIDTLERKVAR